MHIGEHHLSGVQIIDRPIPSNVLCCWCDLKQIKFTKGSEFLQVNEGLVDDVYDPYFTREKSDLSLMMIDQKSF